jgi:glyoxylase-like metal-dependent hydrolase (beta-lactamase superfamily II)/rhodanese-related sulfurtransferase
MLFEQFVRADIGCAAYLVASTDAGEAAIIDPRIDMIDEILAFAERESVRIRYIIETHNHADHVSGHHAIAARTGAAIAVHASAGAAYPHLPLQDGDELSLGEVRLRVVHTPGHRPEHIAIAAIDSARGETPWLVLTGDSLFIGDVARPDLAIDGQEGADALFDSLRTRLMALPDGTLVYPGHVAGSLCGRVNNKMTVTSIGFERAHNSALSFTERRAFVRHMNESLPERPPNMGRIVALNMAAEPLTPAHPLPLDATKVQNLAEAGAFLLDIRTPDDFAAGHLPGSVGVWLDGTQFQNRVGLIMPQGRQLVLVAGTAAEAERAALALSVIGLTDIAGYLNGGIEAWRQAGLPLETVERLSIETLRDELIADQPIRVLDVRESSEWTAGHIDGVANIPFHQLSAQLDSLTPERPVTLICAGGERSMVGAGILQAAGHRSVRNVAGGVDAWRAAGLPLVHELPLSESRVPSKLESN